MIIWSKGNLFDSKADIYCNTVNCVQVMGKGIALQFKQRYPQYFLDYLDACRRGYIKPGKFFCSHTGHENPQQIWSCATKDHWRNPSKLEWIESLLKELEFADAYFHGDIPGRPVTVSLPPLGCGNGGLSWPNQVRPLVIKYLSESKNTFQVFGAAP